MLLGEGQRSYQRGKLFPKLPSSSQSVQLQDRHAAMAMPDDVALSLNQTRSVPEFDIWN